MYSILMRREYCDDARGGTTAFGNWQRSTRGAEAVVIGLEVLVRIVVANAGEGGVGTELSERIIAVVRSCPRSSDAWRFNI